MFGSGQKNGGVGVKKCGGSAEERTGDRGRIWWQQILQVLARSHQEGGREVYEGGRRGRAVSGGSRESSKWKSHGIPHTPDMTAIGTI
jgi:hypothetical protein